MKVGIGFCLLPTSVLIFVPSYYMLPSDEEILQEKITNRNLRLYTRRRHGDNSKYQPYFRENTAKNTVEVTQQ